MQPSGGKMSTDVHNWKYKHLDLRSGVIVLHPRRGEDYPIEYTQARTCRAVCGWLGQIAEKTCGTAEFFGGLVMAFKYINGDLRGID